MLFLFIYVTMSLLEIKKRNIMKDELINMSNREVLQELDNWIDHRSINRHMSNFERYKIVEDEMYRRMSFYKPESKKLKVK